MPTPQPEQISAAILTFLRNNFPLISQGPLSSDEDLLASGVIDSLGLLLVIDFLEASFGISVRDTEVTTENLGTLDTIIRFVQGKLQAAG
jgi:acyl carrier protein